MFKNKVLKKHFFVIIFLKLPRKLEVLACLDHLINSFHAIDCIVPQNISNLLSKLEIRGFFFYKEPCSNSPKNPLENPKVLRSRRLEPVTFLISFVWMLFIRI